VEVERARVTRLLTQILENSQPPQISEAAKTLCELQIETFGSMSRGEKTDFLLEQVRLCIAAKDWLTAENMGRKISTRWFDSKDGDDSTAAADDDAPKYNKIDLKLRYSSHAPHFGWALTAQVLRFDGSVVIASR
jgi:hypothetical protein